MSCVIHGVVHPGLRPESAGCEAGIARRARVNIHQNARTNPYSRALLVARIEGGWTAAEAAMSFGISVRTVRKWRARERAEGLAGLVDLLLAAAALRRADGCGLEPDDL